MEKLLRSNLSGSWEWGGLGVKLLGNEILNFVLSFSILQARDYTKKVPGGGNGGAAGARISSLTLVISLESKLINKIKAMLFWFV